MRRYCSAEPASPRGWVGEGKASGGQGGPNSCPALRPHSFGCHPPPPQPLWPLSPVPLRAPRLHTPLPPPLSFLKLTELSAASGTLHPRWIPVPLGASSVSLPAARLPRPSAHQLTLRLSGSSPGCFFVPQAASSLNLGNLGSSAAVSNSLSTSVSVSQDFLSLRESLGRAHPVGSSFQAHSASRGLPLHRPVPFKLVSPCVYLCLHLSLPRPSLLGPGRSAF